MPNSEQTTITILGSGVALGVYIPALLVNYQLKKHHLKTEVVVLESFYTAESREKLKKHKQVYHQNFSMALMAHRMIRDIQFSLEPELINSLLTTWQTENRLDFIVWSGFWMPILEEYRNRVVPQKLNVDICRIDADISASFKVYTNSQFNDNEIWLWNWEQKRLIYEIPVTNKPSIPYQERNNRFVIHGGGWGIGTYDSKIPDLENRGFELDIVVYDVSETTLRKPKNRYFMVSPNWFPWHKNNSDDYEFPPFREVKDETSFQNREEYHELYDVISQSQAIISKPGGGTLIDSLASATPIILLEPYGYAEKNNADIWEYLGYGISYNQWKAMDYDISILEKLHKNILNRDKKTINYTDNYAKSFVKNNKISIKFAL
ncbi:hypothetical protein [uncultured Nostoc sp.]|uniref:hypothetical protein n=1 Tax=uncultured Nostoc sp. TaxID=340711 RepID=UPI0035CC2255